MMRILFVSFLILFSLAQFYDWVTGWIRDITIPLPVFILGGVILAIASNSDKRTGFFLGRQSSSTIDVSDSVKLQTDSQVLNPPQPSRSISFTIQKSEPKVERSDDQ